MNTLRQFLFHRPNCPLCKSPLSTFHSSNNKEIKLENDQLPLINISLWINPYNSKAGISINIDNHFLQCRSSLPKSDRTISFYLTNKCTSCRKYLAISNDCYLNVENSLLYAENENKPAELYVLNEWFSFFVPPAQEKGRPKIINLDNWFGLNESYESDVSFWNAQKPSLYDDNQLDTNGLPRNYQSIKLPHIPFTTEKQVISRIETLINFS